MSAAPHSSRRPDPGFARESGVMKLLRRLGFDRLAWALRRVHCPVPKDALVLEVGSGGNPYARSNVLLDAFEDSVERYHQPLVNDRPLVYGLIECMPFRSGVFDFVIASHVLEHTTDPARFLNELQRVAAAGYIETPDAFFERINPWRFHRLEVSNDDQGLLLTAKESWKPDPEVVELYERKVKRDPGFRHLLSHYPESFYVRHYWRGTLAWRITNPGVRCDWPLPTELARDPHSGPAADSPLRAGLRSLARALLSQRTRNRHIALATLLRCPGCGHEALEASATEVRCPSCDARYEVRSGVPVMFPPGHVPAAG